MSNQLIAWFLRMFYFNKGDYMKAFLLVIFLLFLSVSKIFANDYLPQMYTSDNINPYKVRLSDLLSFSDNHKICGFENEADYEKYGIMLSRLEKEWFNETYSTLPLSNRIDRLEEHIFGTCFNEDINSRCERLARAFNAQKKHTDKSKSLFSGVPTSVPLSVEELLGK